MRFLFRSGKGAKRRVMHIQSFLRDGTPTFDPMCSTPGPFNRSINAPFGLGRPVCKKCRWVLAGARPTSDAKG